ncbi:MAG: tyrosine-type recombinase/integrase [Filifactoraceae bacterium]
MARIIDRNGKYKVIIELGRDERTGKRMRFTKEGFKTKKEAKAFANIKEAELLNGLTLNTSKMLLKDFINDWYDNHISKTDLSVNTLTGYRARINSHIIPYLGNMSLDKIKTIDIQRFYYTLVNDNKLKPNSAKRVILVLNKAFKYAIKLKLVNHSPCDIEFFKESKETKLKAWDESQLTEFLAYLKDTYLYAPILLTAFTGLRVGELCGLRWDNIDMEKLTLKVCEQVLNDKINKTLIHTSILKTSKSNRTITLPKFLEDTLKDLKENNDEFVICSREGSMCNPRNLSMDFTKKLRKYIKYKNNSLPLITFHDLRHTHATILLLYGENIKVISERLGHESVKITLDTYSHVLPSMNEHTASLLNNAFSKKI